MEISLLIFLYIINYYPIEIKCTFYTLICILQSYWTHLSVLIAFLFGRMVGGSLGFLYTQDHAIFLSNVSGFLLNFCQNSIDGTSSTVLDRVARVDILVCWSDLRDKAFSVSPLVWHLLWSHRCLFIRMRQLLWICCWILLS